MRPFSSVPFASGASANAKARSRTTPYLPAVPLQSRPGLLETEGQNLNTAIDSQALIFRVLVPAPRSPPPPPSPGPYSSSPSHPNSPSRPLTSRPRYTELCHDNLEGAYVTRDLTIRGSIPRLRLVGRFGLAVRPVLNRRFPEITGEDNLTVFSYSGRVKSPERRWQRRRADLRHLEIFRHGPIIIYTRLPAGGTYYSICTFPESSECLIGISDTFSAFCLRVFVILPTCSLYPQQKRACSALHPQAWTDIQVQARRLLPSAVP